MGGYSFAWRHFWKKLKNLLLLYQLFQILNWCGLVNDSPTIHYFTLLQNPNFLPEDTISSTSAFISKTFRDIPTPNVSIKTTPKIQSVFVLLESIFQWFLYHSCVSKHRMRGQGLEVQLWSQKTAGKHCKACSFLNQYFFLFQGHPLEELDCSYNSFENSVIMTESLMQVFRSCPKLSKLILDHCFFSPFLFNATCPVSFKGN